MGVGIELVGRFCLFGDGGAAVRPVEDNLCLCVQDVFHVKAGGDGVSQSAMGGIPVIDQPVRIKP